MKRLFDFFIALALICFDVDFAFAQAPRSGVNFSTGVFHAMVSDYPLSPYLLKGTAPLTKVGVSWGKNAIQDVMVSVAFAKLHPGEVVQNNTSAYFTTLHYSFLPNVVRKQGWHAWAGPALTLRGSYRELEDVSGEVLISLDAKMKLRFLINAKSHLGGSIFFPLVSYVAYRGYALGNLDMDWVSFAKLQSVTAEVSYARALSRRLSFVSAYEFMFYQYALAEKKQVLTQQFQLGLTWHLKSNEI